MLAASTMEAKKDGLRQTQEGLWKLTLTIHPSDMPPWLLAANMGQRLGMTIAALNDDGGGAAVVMTPQTGPRQHPRMMAPSDRRPMESLPVSQQAALLCKDDEFRRWVSASSEYDVVQYVRDFCGVTSRADLDKYPDAAARFRSLRDQFRIASGRIAEPRT